MIANLLRLKNKFINIFTKSAFSLLDCYFNSISSLFQSFFRECSLFVLKNNHTTHLLNVFCISRFLGEYISYAKVRFQAFSLSVS